MKYGFSTSTLAQVATILAKEYGVRVSLGGNQAYTCRDSNTKKWTINIPALATSEQYYMDIMRCYLDHEAGHVRFSDMDMLNREKDNLTRLLKAVWNIFEDVYVERRMAKSFPGCGRNLRVGAEYIFSEDYEAPEDMLSIIIDYILFKARYNASNSKCFENKLENINSFVPDEVKDLLGMYIDRVPTCNSTKATYKLAQDLCEAIKKLVDEKRNESGDGSGGDGEGNGSMQVVIPGDDDELGPLQSGTSGRTEGAAGKLTDSTDMDEAALEALMSSLFDKSDGDGTKSYDLSDRVNNILKGADKNERDEQIVGDRGSEWKVYGVGAGANPKSRIHDRLGRLSDKSISDALKESAKLSSQLAGLLQTIVMNRGGFATRGRLDSRRLARVAVGRPDIFSSRVEKKGLDTEVIIASDVSGSMNGYDWSDCDVPSELRKRKKDVANEAMFSILSALKGIPSVRSMAYVYSDYIAHICGFNDNFTQNTPMFIKTVGGTPTGDAVQHSMTLFSANARRKLLILLTDGEPDNREYFKSSLKLLRAQGIEVVGVGILEDSIERDMKKEECIVINKLTELTPKLFKVLRDKLVKNC